MELNWKLKYLKYKKKYLIFKNQIGGVGCIIDDPKIHDGLLNIFSVSHPVHPSNIIINKCFKGNTIQEFKEFIIKYFNNDNEYIISTLTKPQEFFTKFNINKENLGDNKNYTLILNKNINKLNMYNINLFVSMFNGITENKDNYENFITKSANYIKEQILTYKDGSFNKSIIYLGIAVFNQENFYVPNFIIEQLQDNKELKYTIIIIHNSYKNDVEWDRDVNKNNIIGTIKDKYQDIFDRILFIHVMMTFPNIYDYPELFELFLKTIVINDSYNYCYIGFRECGKLFSDQYSLDRTKHYKSYHELFNNSDINYVFVGCDGLFYKKKILEKNLEKYETKLNNADIKILVN
ncbi:hypothetical protein Indivirus_5_20 [Indivirus ILV1]|uniref:Uncharacterized protein n=1 Tax=Indivirus ILV1 TaxID=1977633 RepID=A0A1V0SDV9_9VIRU|nr:hypothetical protein Indivirus_5_20 [Indivirus ILV1]